MKVEIIDIKQLMCEDRKGYGSWLIGQPELTRNLFLDVMVKLRNVEYLEFCVSVPVANDFLTEQGLFHMEIEVNAEPVLNLTVFLPGFLKQQIRIRAEQSIIFSVEENIMKNHELKRIYGGV